MTGGDRRVHIEPAGPYIENSGVLFRNFKCGIAIADLGPRERFHTEVIGDCALLYLAEKGLARKAHIEHTCPVQELRPEFLLGLLPHFARALRQGHISGALRIGQPIDAGAARMAAAAMRGSELIERGNGKASSGQLHCGETAHGPEADDGHIVVSRHNLLLS